MPRRAGRRRLTGVAHNHRGWVDTSTRSVAPVGKPPGWYHVDEQTLRYWEGVSWTDWTATWNGKKLGATAPEPTLPAEPSALT